jgi:hypothetical protein
MELTRFRGYFPLTEKQSTMAKRRTSPLEFKRRILELARSKIRGTIDKTSY